MKYNQINNDAIIIEELKARGRKLGLNWYEYDGLYYHIADGKIVYEKQTDLTLNEPEGWFILGMKNRTGSLIYINGYTKVLVGVLPEDIKIYPDHFILYPINEKSAMKLSRYDMEILTADDIYRLNREIWVAVSNGVYYMKDLSNNPPVAIGRHKIYLSEDGIPFFTDDNGVRVNVELSTF